MKKYSFNQIRYLNSAFVQLDPQYDSSKEIEESHIEFADDKEITPECAVDVNEKLNQLEKHLKYLKLTFSLELLNVIRRNLNKGYGIGKCDKYNFERYRADLSILHDRISDEIKDITFGFIPKEKTQFFEQEALFGKEVNERFPSAIQDISEAGNCYAYGLYTACVFHLMRVVEIGAKSMVCAMKAQKHITTSVSIKGTKTIVKKPIELCDWGTLIKGLESSIRELEQGTKTSLKKKEMLAYYSHAVGVFRNFKDAWRNNVAHSHKIYDVEETKNIIDNTKQFLKHLALKVKE